jgi:hypothetical protein
MLPDSTLLKPCIGMAAVKGLFRAKTCRVKTRL